MAFPSQVVYRIGVFVNGQSLAAEIASLLVSAVIDSNVNLPDLAILEFTDSKVEVLEKGGFEIAKELVIKVFDGQDQGGERIFVGEVTGIESEFDRTGKRTIVRGYDLSHRLHRGRRTKAYLKMKADEIVQEVAEGAKVPVGEVVSGGDVFAHIGQVNQDDWTFLRGLAADVGYELSVLDGKLCFKPPAKAEGSTGSPLLANTDPMALVVGDSSVLRIRVSITGAEQVGQTSALAWDMQQKTAATASAPAPDTIRSAKPNGATPAALAAKFGSRPFVASARPFRSQSSLKTLATTNAERIAGGFAEVEAEVVGNPKLRPGAVVSITGVGKPLEGKYAVSAARHLFEAGESYRTVVTVSDRRDRSLLGLVGTHRRSVPERGVVPAIVTDNDDKELKLARVKLQFPWLDATYESDWSRVIQDGAGSGRGWTVLPEVGDEVMVAFENGDFNRPYVLGGVYNGKDMPKLSGPKLVGGRKVMTRAFYSRTGHAMEFFDDEGKQGTITLCTNTGTTKVIMGGETTGVTIQSDQEIVIKSDAKVTVQAAQQVALKAAEIKIEADASLELKAATIKIEAEGPLTAKGEPIQLN